MQAATEMWIWDHEEERHWGLPGQGVEWQEMGWGQLQPDCGQAESGAGGTADKGQFLFPKAGSWGKANHLVLCQSHKNPFLPAWIQRNKHSFTIHSAVLLNPVCFCIRIDVCYIYWNPVNLLFPSLDDLLLLLLSKCILCPLWLGFNHPSGQWREFNKLQEGLEAIMQHTEKNTWQRVFVSPEQSQRETPVARRVRDLSLVLGVQNHMGSPSGIVSQWFPAIMKCHCGSRDHCSHCGQSELPSAAGCLQTAAHWHIYPPNRFIWQTSGTEINLSCLLLTGKEVKDFSIQVCFSLHANTSSFWMTPRHSTWDEGANTNIPICAKR